MAEHPGTIPARDRPLRRYALPLAVYAGAFLAFYGATLRKLVGDWYHDPNYSHGFLIPLVSAWFLWQRRRDLPAPAGRASPAGLAILLLGVAAFVAGHLSGEYFTMRLSMVVVLAGTVAFAAGPAFLWAVALPVGYLLFMVPLPYLLYDSVAFPLKMLVSRLSVGSLQALGYTVLREGNVITFPEMTLEVADACSGIRSLISLLALATAAGAVALRGWPRRVALVLLAVPVAVAVNAVRVVGTGMLASRYGLQVAEGFYHEFAGLAIFGGALLLLAVAAWALARVGRGGERK